MSELLPNVCVEDYNGAIRECRSRREIMAWVAERLRRWEPLLPEADRPTCRELRHALTDSPKLKGV